MQILLRTAGTLERACSEAIARLEITPTTRTSVHVINVDSSAGTYLGELSTTTQKNIDQVLALLEAQWTIRRLKGEANAPRVSPIMTEERYLDAVQKQLEVMLPKHRVRGAYEDRSAVRVKHAVKELQTAVQSMREWLKSGTASDGPDTIEVANLTDEQTRSLERRIEGIRRRRIELNDLKAKDNLTRSITLPSDVVVTLRRHGIIEPELK